MKEFRSTLNTNFEFAIYILCCLVVNLHKLPEQDCKYGSGKLIYKIGGGALKVRSALNQSVIKCTVFVSMTLHLFCELEVVYAFSQKKKKNFY